MGDGKITPSKKDKTEITYRAALLRGTTEVERIFSRGGQNCTRAPSLPTGSLNKAKKAVAEPPTAMERIAELVEHQRKMEERLANVERWSQDIQASESATETPTKKEEENRIEQDDKGRTNIADMKSKCRAGEIKMVDLPVGGDDTEHDEIPDSETGEQQEEMRSEHQAEWHALMRPVRLEIMEVAAKRRVKADFADWRRKCDRMHIQLLMTLLLKGRRNPERYVDLGWG